MPQTALKHLAKKAGITIGQAEHHWHVASNVVKKEYDIDENDGKYWALTMGIAKKMMGLKESLSFKDFLKEADVGEKPKYTQIDFSQAVNEIKTHCKNAISGMIRDNEPIWRGDYEVVLTPGNALLVDSSATKRMSENTSNQYTILFDNNPANAAYPQRSRSFICSASRWISKGYGSTPSVIIPHDTAKIGVVNRYDMWETKISMFGSRTTSIEGFNSAFHSIDLLRKPKWEAFKTFDKELKDGDDVAFKQFKNFLERLHLNTGNSDKAIEELAQEYKNVFLETLLNTYDYKKLGMSNVTTANLPHLEDSEMWISGKMVILSEEDFKKLRLELFPS